VPNWYAERQTGMPNNFSKYSIFENKT
jgi:hypothetical protein